MPFIPHTEEDIQAMLETINVSSINALFDEVPEHLMLSSELKLPKQVNEMTMGKLMNECAKKDDGYLCFLGGGAYEHHIPAAVWELTGRGEFLTAYTPYQAEASQGGLQLIYEFQTMMASLTGMDVSNASLYDGASALAEAVLMAVRCNKKVKNSRVLCVGSLSPLYRAAVETIIKPQGIELDEVFYCEESGTISLAELDKIKDKNANALIIQQPNFLGNLEKVNELTDWAHKNNLLVIAVVNPTSLALLKPPGKWGEQGADIACGDGQPLGIPLASGGPSFGFLTSKMPLVRQMPGRIVGRTVDQDGKEGFALTLQAREQHIRRAKAKSNICTNQGLLVVAATIYMSLLGPVGLKKVALACHQNAKVLLEKLILIQGVKQHFNSSVFNEFVLELPISAKQVIDQAAKEKILIGLELKAFLPNENDNLLLVAVTETKTEDELECFVNTLKTCVEKTSTKQRVEV
jgi:glycine dehydrogenase subunit 1